MSSTNTGSLTKYNNRNLPKKTNKKFNDIIFFKERTFKRDKLGESCLKG